MSNLTSMSQPHDDELDELRLKWWAKLDKLNIKTGSDEIDRKVNGLVSAARAIQDAIITMTPAGGAQETALEHSVAMTRYATRSLNKLLKEN